MCGRPTTSVGADRYDAQKHCCIVAERLASVDNIANVAGTQYEVIVSLVAWSSHIRHSRQGACVKCRMFCSLLAAARQALPSSAPSVCLLLDPPRSQLIKRMSNATHVEQQKCIKQKRGWMLSIVSRSNRRARTSGSVPRAHVLSCP